MKWWKKKELDDKTMEEKTSILLEKLAAKLGTTVEHLWAVTIKQASIVAVTNTLHLCLALLFLWLLRVLHKRFSKQINVPDSIYTESVYDRSEAAQVCMAVAVMLCGIYLLFGLIFISETITALINPEFWALSQFLNALKN